MNAPSSHIEYQLKVVLADISPMIWRRFVIPGNLTLADFHYILQIAFGWSDYHLHRFIIYGKEYGIPRSGGYWFDDDASNIKFEAIGLRQRERFVYEYDGFDQWKHDIRVEAISQSGSQAYPICVAGKRSGPPEDCGGAQAFLALKQQYSRQYIAGRFAELILEGNLQAHRSELRKLHYWVSLEDFDRQSVNQRLQRTPLQDDPAFVEEVIYF